MRAMPAVSVPAGASFAHPVPPGHTVFAYVVDGAGHFEGPPDGPERAPAAGTGTLLLYGPGDGVRVLADRYPVRFILVAGKPLGEPVAWYGPVVMNTQDELRTAFREFEAGTFVKHPRYAEIRATAGEWRLLLQVHGMEEAGMCWGDAGCIYFWIPEAALKARDFGAIWMIFQCH